MTRFQKKNYLNRIIWTIAVLFALGITALFIPSDNGDYKKAMKEKIALNFAATVAQTADKYNVETDSIDFIGTKIGFDNHFLMIGKNKIPVPVDYNCTINDSSVIVTHVEGAKVEVDWR